jgi:ABC-type uncharacterized transport system YnjBCD ATPase subunit
LFGKQNRIQFQMSKLEAYYAVFQTMFPIGTSMVLYYSFLQALPEEADDGEFPESLGGGIELSHVCFRYAADEALTIRDVSLRVNPGAFVAIVGESGSGKSTLLRLMLGFEKPESGIIGYDGKDLARLDIQAVRRQLGVVLQNGGMMAGDLCTQAENPVFRRTEAFQGIVEMDETYFLFSEKGKRNIADRKPRKRGGKAKCRGISNDQVCVLVARDRQKMTYSGVLERGRIRTTKLDEAIGGHISDSNVLCTDSWRAFSSYSNSKGLAHYRFKSDGKQRVKGMYHIQNVNSYHSRLKRGWIALTVLQLNICNIIWLGFVT